MSDQILTEAEVAEVSGGQYSGKCIRYMIQPGDTLSGIALRYHTTVQVLADLNHIQNVNYIRAYDYLLIPVN